jgi:hypothetical protein
MRGFADQHLRNKNDSADPANRRISLIVQYLAGEAVVSPESKADSAKQRAAEPIKE